MSVMPQFPLDNDSLLKVDRAHRALELTLRSQSDELDAEVARIAQKHNPFIYAAQSVLYEAMGNASLAGFSSEEMQRVMDCDYH
jgi:hypothetical protein